VLNALNRLPIRFSPVSRKLSRAARLDSNRLPSAAFAEWVSWDALDAWPTREDKILSQDNHGI
jgi:hypothetical protein